MLLVDGHHPAEQLAIVDHHVVGQQGGEGLVADVVTGRPDGMAQAQRLVLANGVDVGQVGKRPDLLQLGQLALPLEEVLQLGARIEVVLHLALRPLVTMQTSRAPAETASSTAYWMAGLVDHRQHLLGWALVAGRNRPRARPPG